jgi:cytoskeleton protein RodZ
MTSIGDTLRRERLRRGLDLDKVAAETKIGRHQLEAIEANQFDRLPGGVFARSFIRQYARLLELDDEEIIAQLKQQFDEPADTAPLAEPQPSSRLPYMPSLADLYDRLRSDSSLAAFVWVVIAVLVCAGIYSLWQRSRQPMTQAAIATAPRPPASRAAEPASRVAEPAPRVAEPASLKPSVPTESVESTKAESLKTSFIPAEVADNGTIRVPGRPPEPASPRETAGKPEAFPVAMRVAFTASEPVWVSIKSDGTRAYTGTIEGQESKQFDASRKMTVLVGNAGALQISLNGKHVGPIGPRGEIRLLVLTPHGAHVVPRTPPTPSSTSDVPDAPAEAERP